MSSFLFSKLSLENDLSHCWACRTDISQFPSEEIWRCKGCGQSFCRANACGNMFSDSTPVCSNCVVDESHQTTKTCGECSGRYDDHHPRGFTSCPHCPLHEAKTKRQATIAEQISKQPPVGSIICLTRGCNYSDNIPVKVICSDVRGVVVLMPAGQDTSVPREHLLSDDDLAPSKWLYASEVTPSTKACNECWVKRPDVQPTRIHGRRCQLDLCACCRATF